MAKKSYNIEKVTLGFRRFFASLRLCAFALSSLSGLQRNGAKTPSRKAMYAQARDLHARHVMRHPWEPWEPFDSLRGKDVAPWMALARIAASVPEFGRS